MSYDDDFAFGTYTAQGFPAWASYYYDYDEDCDCEDDYETILNKRAVKKKLFTNKIAKEAVKLIAGLSHKRQIQNKIVKKLINDGLDRMICRYAQKENLSLEYVEIAQQKNCLSILINGFLKKFGNYALTKELIIQVNNIIEDIYINDELEIVYKRVSKIQKFLHGKIDEKHGKASHLNIPVKPIKDLLSASRLHLNIYDIKYKDINSLLYLFCRSKEASDAELAKPSKIALAKNKRYVKNWQVRHMKSLIYLFPQLDRSKIHRIMNLDKDLPIDDFKKSILDIYCRKDCDECFPLAAENNRIMSCN